MTKQDTRALKIKILLGIDVTFFLIELISGLLLGSLALLSDSFHVFNDVVSLVVALYALNLANSSSAPSSTYSYGWQRAEVLGALVNGVFLLALCVSVGLEAISRLFGDVEIQQSIVMVYVGSAGLLSNIVGLFLFHDHGHSHGHSHSHSKDPESHGSHGEHSPLLNRPEEAIDEAEEELFVHPGEFRGNIVRAAQDAGYGSTGHTHSHTRSNSHSHHYGNGHAHEREDDESDDEHAHEHGESSGGHGGHSHGGHSHDGSMNMQGVFLHVMGDALGNVGVILAGVIITWTEWKYRMYADPVVSLIITCIIFAGALPLVKSASFILLQGVPSSVPLDQVRNEIAAVKGVLNVHELHIWSLSESKTVCSVHVLTNGKDFVQVSDEIRRVLHRFGVHSSTIQPELVETKRIASAVASIEDQEGCTVSCVDDSCRENACCPPGVSSVPNED